MMDCEPFVTQQDPSSDSVERISWMPRAVWIRHREDMQGAGTAQAVSQSQHSHDLSEHLK